MGVTSRQTTVSEGFGCDGGVRETTVSEKDDHGSNNDNADDKDEDGNLNVKKSSSSRPPRKRKRKRKQASTQDEDDAASSSKKNPSASNSTSEENAVARTVFVDGVPYEASDDEVQSFFTNLTIVSCRLPRWQDSGRLRGYGHVEFASVKDQQAALQLSGQSLPGYSRYLTIQPARQPKDVSTGDHHDHTSSNNQPSRTILLKNLSYQATEDDITQIMSSFGAIVSNGGIRIARHNRNKQSKGFAYCEYVDLTSAQNAMQRYYQQSPQQSSSSKFVICGRPCVLDYDHGSIQKSFRTETGRLWQKQYGNNNKKQHQQHHRSATKKFKSQDER